MRCVCLLFSLAVAQCVSDASTVDLGAFGGRVKVCTPDTCGCPPGFAGALCVACVPGFFKPGHGAGECQACPPKSSSLPASSSGLGCLCQPGYFAEAGQCVECPDNMYKEFHGPGACMACPANSTSAKANARRVLCLCDPGYSGSLPCSVCAAGKYKAGHGDSPCEDCAENTYGEHSGAASASTCTVCPSASTTLLLTGQVGAASCLCSAKHYMAAGVCTLCAQNTHCPGRNQVLPCPQNTHGGEGLELAAECECDDGYYRNGTRCLSCVSDHWCAGGGMTPCMHDSSSGPLSTSAQDCVCVGGTQRRTSGAPVAPTPV